MTRKKPVSQKQKKAALQEKRAIKRGDAPAPEPQPRRKPGGSRGGRGGAPAPNAEAASARKLQSAFVKMSPEFLERTKALASNIPLPRPLPPQAAVFPYDFGSAPQLEAGQLTCPKRPKWRFEMSKKEVEKNEEGLFKKWIAQTDNIVEDWCHPPDQRPKNTANASDDHSGAFPKAPTQFERNLEVWRQLWRVNEISNILLVLLDSRCPLLHYPPALASYLSGKAVILVLTKVDITGPVCSDAWVAHLQSLLPGMRVIQVESYTPRQAGENTQDQQQESSRDKRHTALEPRIPLPFREKLVQTLKEVHAELLQPPEKIKNDEEKLKKWKPRVRRDVDWNAVLEAHGGQVGHAVGGSVAPVNAEASEDECEAPEPEHLTVGLIGQPNVGKSSLLNALFGTTKVRASKTPGKTRHFQTLFWTPEVRLVDCPGLVFPNLVPMEMQVLAGVLPISRVSAISACIHYAARLLPLEQVLRLQHPSINDPPTEDRRTWRDGTERSGRPIAKDAEWTAMDVLTAYAEKKGWVTAKAGRPDVNRAGNAILRALAEGRIRWAFWPSEAAIQSNSVAELEKGLGIWMPFLHYDASEDGITDDNDDDNASALADENEDRDGTDMQSVVSNQTDEEEVSDESENELIAKTLKPTTGRFGALTLQDEDEEHESSENEESDIE